MSDFQNRLESFLLNRNQPLDIEQLTPDASTREYFRVSWNGDTAIACVYPEPFVAADQSYLDVTNVFLAAGLPVAAIYESIDATPAHQKDLVEANAIYRNGDPDTMARAEEIVQAHVAAHADIMAVPAAERQAAHARF